MMLPEKRDKDFMKEYVEKNILAFWLDHAIDREMGGVFMYLDRDGSLYGTDKQVWFQGRVLYTLCNAYRTGIKRPEYLEAAKLLFDFLPKCIGEDGKMYFVVTRDGRPIRKSDDMFSETFAAIGCAEYALVTGREDAKEMAYRFFDKAWEIYEGECRAIEAGSLDAGPFKTNASAMILLSTAQVLRKLDKERFDAIAKQMCGELLAHLSDKGLRENIGKNGEFLDHVMGRKLNPGHSLEAAWFLMAEGQYQNDRALMEAGRRIVDISMAYGYRDGGIIAFCDCDGYPPEELEWDMKIWWPQCEAIIANRLCYEIFGEKKYLDASEAILRFMFDHYEDREQGGEWFGYLHADNTVSNTLKGNLSKGAFHLPRMFMDVWRMDNGRSVLE